MGLWAAPALATSVLLIATGSAKALHPNTAAVGLPLIRTQRRATTTNRVVGVIEVVVGLAGVVIGSRLIDAVTAALFVGFGVVSLVGVRSQAPTCGCVGKTDTPPTMAHVAMSAIFAGVAAVAAAVGDRSSLLAVASRHSTAIDIGLIVSSLAVSWLAWTVLSLGRLHPRPEGRVTGRPAT
jgi:hypothetical protein